MTRARWVIVLVLSLAVLCGARVALKRAVGGDFLRYHRAGRLVATGNADRIYDTTWLAEQRVYAAERAADLAARGDDADDFQEYEFKYAPALAVLMAPFGALHPRLAWVLWGAWNGALLGLTLAAAFDFAARGGGWRWMLLPAIVLARSQADNVALGQVNLSAIGPATVALWAIDRGRDGLAAGAAAFGAVVKYYPAALAIWFAWKGRWRAAVATVSGFLLLTAAIPTVVLGPAASLDLHTTWLAQRTHVYAGAEPDDVPGHSVKSFVYRVFGGTNYVTGPESRRFDEDIAVTQASPETLRAVVLAVSAALLALVLAASRGPLRRGPDLRGPTEAGLFVCWMLLASPEARSPHFVYLMLPLAALTYGLVRSWRGRLPGRRAATALAAAGVILLNAESRTLLGDDLSNFLSACCVQGWATLVFLCALLVVLADERRRDAAPAERPL